MGKLGSGRGGGGGGGGLEEMEKVSFSFVHSVEKEDREITTSGDLCGLDSCVGKFTLSCL